ncbi:MAG: transcriptional regulator, LysR family [Armatimonadetes bacterium]|nr:transcriptional regulator, LysR family [Armatimonadota bacterium]
MEIFQLRYFAAAARLLHFSRAADELFVAQPSLSQQIGKLEAELGAPLFHRQGRRVTLTDAGKALLPLAERILEQEAEAKRVVQQVAGLERGRLSLCALPALDQHLLPPWLARFRRDFPGIEIRVRELRPARAVAQAVLGGQADLGFVHLPCEAAGLEVRPLLDDPLALAVPEGHPLAQCETVRLEVAAEADFVWVHEAQEPEHPLYAACLAAGFRPRVVCESGSAQGVLALVAAGLGIALLPRLAIEPRPGVRVLPLAEPAPSRTLAVLWQPDALSHAARAFLELCGPQKT